MQRELVLSGVVNTEVGAIALYTGSLWVIKCLFKSWNLRNGHERQEAVVGRPTVPGDSEGRRVVVQPLRRNPWERPAECKGRQKSMGVRRAAS